MNLREIQAPLKDQYRAEPSTARITLSATASSADESPAACSVDLGRAIYAAEAHAGVGGAGTAACSGDLLLAALAACAQLTCQMAATASGVPFDEIRVTVEGDLDLRGILGRQFTVQVGDDLLEPVLVCGGSGGISHNTLTCGNCAESTPNR